jgi:hypothetical protein
MGEGAREVETVGSEIRGMYLTHLRFSLDDVDAVIEGLDTVSRHLGIISSNIQLSPS